MCVRLRANARERLVSTNFESLSKLGRLNDTGVEKVVVGETRNFGELSF